SIFRASSLSAETRSRCLMIVLPLFVLSLQAPDEVTESNSASITSPVSKSNVLTFGIVFLQQNAQLRHRALLNLTNSVFLQSEVLGDLTLHDSAVLSDVERACLFH